ncbi:glycosyltransferase [Streptomyces sp. NPDC005355]|uniref:glycosyltransferase n=1 Tax=Streptomyces sp. NPDC005355 TaxID=3157038 RepID=UPI0033A2BEB2
MHVSLVVTGSRGDVQPFIALGRALRSREHTVTLATHEDFAALVREAELDFTALPGSPRDFLQHPALAEALQQGASLFRAARKVPRQSSEHNRELAARVAEVSAGADLVVNSILSRIMFEDDGSTPWCSLSWWPLNPTAQWPAMMAPQVRLGRLYNRLTHRLAGMLDSATMRNYRKDAGLPQLPFGAPYGNLGREVPLLCPVSRTLFTEPADWPDLSHITGYWFWDRKWAPSPELVEFMESGTPPVTLSFGSIWPVHPPAKTLEKVLNVVRSHGRRLVLVGGGPDTVPDDVIRVDDAHYPWLFPRSSVVIHHGGCNTTGEALRSGTPQVVVPTFGDGPFWAAQVHALGVAAKPVPFSKFTVEALDEALGVALTDEPLRAKAAKIGEAVRAEDGTGKAVDILEEWVRRWHSRRSTDAAA